MNQKLILILVIFGIVIIGGFIQKISKNEPDWVQELIQKEINGPVANPPALLSKCTYNGNITYYLPSRCCDIPSTLYDKDGNVICSPDGGLTGTGDGKCTDFFDKRKDCEIIWEDTHPYP